jgi:hypothetical protein
LSEISLQDQKLYRKTDKIPTFFDVAQNDSQACSVFADEKMTWENKFLTPTLSTGGAVTARVVKHYFFTSCQV